MGARTRKRVAHEHSKEATARTQKHEMRTHTLVPSILVPCARGRSFPRNTRLNGSMEDDAGIECRPQRAERRLDEQNVKVDEKHDTELRERPRIQL